MKTVEMEVMTGSHIDWACEEAVKRAKNGNCKVSFKFNGVQLFATPKKSPSTMRWEFDIASDRELREYHKSKEYLEYKKKREIELAANQVEVDRLISILPQAIQSGLSDTVAWCSAFSQIADDIGLKYSCADISELLVQAGYVDGENCNLDKGAYRDSVIFGRWIVGQAINGLNQQLPPHPITKKFADEYFGWVGGK